MKILPPLLIMIPLSLFGLGKSDKTAPKNISPADAKAMLGKDASCVLLDVRTKDEFNEGHIKGAKLIPVAEIAVRAENELPDKDAAILVYCRSGNRSARAAGILAAMGYTNVYDLGGIRSWPYEIVKD